MPRSRLVSSCDHDGFDAKANLTINNVAVTRCYIGRGSILDWTAVHACSTLSFITVKGNKFHYVFLGVSFDASFQRIQHLR